MAFAAASSQAAANDSAAELPAGGIVLVKTEAITMQREDLTVSPSAVRDRYEMRNDTGQPVTLRVAFPLPEVPSDSPDGMTVSGGTYNGIAIKPPTDPNFLDFHVSANQHELTPDIEIHAVLPNGRDITAALREIGGMPLVLQPGLFDSSANRKLDAETRRKLKALGAIEEPDADTFHLPWVTHVTFHWMQTFAPGVTVIEHTYRPVLGFRLIVVDGAKPLTASGGEDLAKAFCIDPPTDKAIRAEGARLKAAAPKRCPGSLWPTFSRPPATGAARSVRFISRCRVGRSPSMASRAAQCGSPRCAATCPSPAPGRSSSRRQRRTTCPRPTSTCCSSAIERSVDKAVESCRAGGAPWTLASDPTR